MMLGFSACSHFAMLVGSGAGKREGLFWVSTKMTRNPRSQQATRTIPNKTAAITVELQVIAAVAAVARAGFHNH